MTLVTEAAGTRAATEATTANPRARAPRCPRRGRRGCFAAQQVIDDAHDHSSHSHALDVDRCTLVTNAHAESIVGPVLERRLDGVGGELCIDTADPTGAVVEARVTLKTSFGRSHPTA